MKASKVVSTKGRFARSVNVERDAGKGTIDGYLPTGRALDVITRVARSISNGDPSGAFSITGPYGSGKSSLAVFLDAILGPEPSDGADTALRVLHAVDPDLAETFERVRSDVGEAGFIRAVVTASREPISATVVRALAAGVHRFDPAKRVAAWRRTVKALDGAVAGLADPDRALPTTRFLRDTIEAIAEFGPVLLVIDEFGKNLEAFADSRSDSDLYLLQELVEWSHAPSVEGGLPVVTITMQHLAFEDYLDAASQALRREWAKVQGRFEDIPYVDTPHQTLHLISQVHDHRWPRKQRSLLDQWVASATDGAREAGIRHELPDDSTIGLAWPLHPSTLLILPDLCARYGQNERTLFSFLASPEPLATPAWLDSTNIDDPLVDVRLTRVYDYFVESASTTAGTSQTASRWVEVETAVRDATGLSDAERRVLKAIGLLNLVSAGGSLRASRAMLMWACADGLPGTKTEQNVMEVLAALERAGRITYREFADEFRIWRGSDVDLRAALDSARRALRGTKTEDLLTAAMPLQPIVAARHSTTTGTLRAFAREWDSDGAVQVPSLRSTADGLLAYVVGENLPVIQNAEDEEKPLVAVRPADTDELLRTATELAAIRQVLDDDDTVGDDWVARRELAEREAEALIHFDAAFEAAVGHNASGASWWRITTGEPERITDPASVTAALSDICDLTFPATPTVPNEMLNRQELTSQGAKARRLLIEALIERNDTEQFGIDGFPPERAMYDAVFTTSGMHRATDDGWIVQPPEIEGRWNTAWNVVLAMFDQAKSHRVSCQRILDALAAPPVGMKAGPAPVLLVAAIVVNRHEVAVYEHGTYRPKLTLEVAERFVRNPDHFQIKHFAASRGPRRKAIQALAEEFQTGIVWSKRPPSVLSVVGHFVATLNGLPEYSKKTRNISESAQKVRRAMLDSTEPDVLLFEALPAALGHPVVPARKSNSSGRTQAYVNDLGVAFDEIESSYHKLLDDIMSDLQAAVRSADDDYRADVRRRCQVLAGSVLDPRLRSLIHALTIEAMDDREWAANVAMVVVGPPTVSWGDEQRLLFAANIAELGGLFHRIELLSYESRAVSGQRFNAVRLTLTRPTGRERGAIVAIPESVNDVLNDEIENLIASAEAATGGTGAGLETLLAILTDRFLPEAGGPKVSRPGCIVGQAIHGEETS